MRSPRPELALRGQIIRQFLVGFRPERPTIRARGRRIREPSIASGWQEQTRLRIALWVRSRREGPGPSIKRPGLRIVPALLLLRLTSATLARSGGTGGTPHLTLSPSNTKSPTQAS